MHLLMQKSHIRIVHSYDTHRNDEDTGAASCVTHTKKGQTSLSDLEEAATYSPT